MFAVIWSGLSKIKIYVLNRSKCLKPFIMFWAYASIYEYKLLYLIGQNFVGQNFRWTKYFVGQNFRHQAQISTLLSDFCLTFVLKYWTKFSTDKIFRRTKFSTPSQNFDTFVRRIFVR